MSKGLSESDEWVLVPNEEDVRQLESLSSQNELNDTKPHDRYSSPLFKELLGKPIEPVKLKKPTIPQDDSINNLLHAANLVSKTQKTPETENLAREEEHIKLTPINNINDVSSVEPVDEHLLKAFSVTEKRSSIQDPEQVLMKNVVPGKTSF